VSRRDCSTNKCKKSHFAPYSALWAKATIQNNDANTKFNCFDNKSGRGVFDSISAPRSGVFYSARLQQKLRTCKNFAAHVQKFHCARAEFSLRTCENFAAHVQNFTPPLNRVINKIYSHILNLIDDEI
jgi:hypothetical protein